MLLKSESSSPHSRLLSDKTSGAWGAAALEWPVNLTKIIDRLAKCGYRSENDGVAQAQAQAFIQQLSALKYELTHNKTISVDNEVYNAQLEAMGRPKWMDVPWIFAESVLNLRISAVLSSPEEFEDADHPVEDGERPTRHPGLDQLMNLARRGQPNGLARTHRSRIFSDASTFHSRMRRLKQTLSPPQSAELERSIFRSFCQDGLGGRAIERSLLPSVQTSIDFPEYTKLNSHLLVDDTQAVYKVLERARTEQKEQRRVDIVLGGDGIELSDNLLLALFLLERQLATSVVLHVPRSLQDPVAPTTSTYLKDFATIYQVPEEPDSSGDGAPSPEDLLPRLHPGEKNHLALVNELLEKWQHGHQGALTLQEDPFWSYWYSFWELQEHAPELLKQFQEAEVVIVRGDFNYRKLTEDAEWPASTPFATAIGPMGAEYGIRTLSLRTIESNSVVGMGEGQSTTLRKERGPSSVQEGDRSTQLDKRKWLWNGGFVLLQFCDGKAV